MFNRLVRYSAISNESRLGFLIEKPLVEYVELVTVKVNWMCNLIIDIHENHFNDRIKFQLDQVGACASS